MGEFGGNGTHITPKMGVFGVMRRARSRTSSLVDNGSAVELVERREAPGAHRVRDHDGAVLGIAALLVDALPVAVLAALGGHLEVGDVADEGVLALDAVPFGGRDHLAGHVGILSGAGPDSRTRAFR